VARLVCPLCLMISEIYCLAASQMRWFSFYVCSTPDGLCEGGVWGLLMCPHSGFSVLITFARLAHHNCSDSTAQRVSFWEMLCTPNMKKFILQAVGGVARRPERRRRQLRPLHARRRGKHATYVCSWNWGFWLCCFLCWTDRLGGSAHRCLC
jgi:hypothetical protein